MKKMLFASLLLAWAAGRPAPAQTQTITADQTNPDDKPYTYVEQMPQLPGGGGNAAIVAAVQERLSYPAEALRNQVEGRVFVSFIVGTTGQIRDIKVVKGLGAGLDEAAVQAVQLLPRFVAGKQNGRNVSVSFTLPITFKLGTGPELAPENRTYSYVEKMPELPAGPVGKGQPGAAPGALPPGQAALQAAVQRALVLPPEVVDGRSEGTVYVQFVVDKAGRATQPTIERGLCAACDTAVVRAVRQLPRFAPGQLDGRPVAVRLTLPVSLISPNHVARPEELSARPRFPAPGLTAYLRRSLRVPAVVKTENLRGRVRVEFIVRASGQVEAAEVKTPLCASCDAEALRVVRAFPAWTPARDRNQQPIGSRQTVDVPFPLPDPASAFIKPENMSTYTQQQPTLLDGDRDYTAAITQALRYPEAARREKINGVVGVQFIVDAQGLVREPRITRSLCTTCDQAVLDAVAQLGLFTPGRTNEQDVPTTLNAQITFAPAGK